MVPQPDVHESMTHDQATLLLVTALSDVSRRPIRAFDLYRFMRKALVDQRVLGGPNGEELRQELRTSRPSDLSVSLRLLSHFGLLTREPRGYELTEEGRKQAAALLSEMEALGSSLAELTRHVA